MGLKAVGRKSKKKSFNQLFSHERYELRRERILTDDELVRVMIGNVKVQAPAKMQQQQKSAEKRERKERATERAKQKEAEKAGGEVAAE